MDEAKACCKNETKGHRFIRKEGEMLKKRDIDPLDPYKPPEWGILEQEIRIGDRIRRILTYIPDNICPASAGILILGPDGQSAEELLADSGWKELAEIVPEEERMALFFLEPENGQWNIAEEYETADGDVAYVYAAFMKCFERLHYDLHESRIYLYGTGEGGRIAQMAAMSEPAGYAGLVIIGAGDVPKTYCSACMQDYCENLNGFADPLFRKKVRKGEIPMPVWIMEQRGGQLSQNILNYWVHANRAEKRGNLAKDDVTVYERAEAMPYPDDQDREACCVWHSVLKGPEGCREEPDNLSRPTEQSWIRKENQNAVLVSTVWNSFMSRFRRWMADPGGSLRTDRRYRKDPDMEFYREAVDGWMREWMIYVPPGVKAAPGREVPMVLALHGYGCTGEIYAGNTDWPRIAREYGFITVFPTGIPAGLERDIDPDNPNNIPVPAWNFTCETEGRPDDVHFLRKLTERVCAEYPVDKSRIYATGHSQGSLMVQRLAVAMPEVFAAVAPCSGVIFGAVFDAFVRTAVSETSVQLPVWMLAGQEESWLIEAQPEPENATGKTITFWHRRNGLPGTAESRFRHHWNRYRNRWLDLTYEDSDNHPMLRYTQVEYMPHATMPEMSRRIWEEFFACWSRTGRNLTFFTEKNNKTA